MLTVKALKELLKAIGKDADVMLPRLNNLVREVAPNRAARFSKKLGIKGEKAGVGFKQFTRWLKSQKSKIGKKF